MDDGSINTYNATHLNTDSFTIEEVKLLQNSLLNNFQLKTRLVEKRPNQWIIVIGVRQIVSLASIV